MQVENIGKNYKPSHKEIEAGKALFLFWQEQQQIRHLLSTNTNLNENQQTLLDNAIRLRALTYQYPKEISDSPFCKAIFFECFAEAKKIFCSTDIYNGDSLTYNPTMLNEGRGVKLYETVGAYKDIVSFLYSAEGRKITPLTAKTLEESTKIVRRSNEVLTVALGSGMEGANPGLALLFRDVITGDENIKRLAAGIAETHEGNINYVAKNLEGSVKKINKEAIPMNFLNKQTTFGMGKPDYELHAHIGEAFLRFADVANIDPSAAMITVDTGNFNHILAGVMAIIADPTVFAAADAAMRSIRMRPLLKANIELKFRDDAACGDFIADLHQQYLQASTPAIIITGDYSKLNWFRDAAVYFFGYSAGFLTLIKELILPAVLVAGVFAFLTFYPVLIASAVAHLPGMITAKTLEFAIPAIAGAIPLILRSRKYESSPTKDYQQTADNIFKPVLGPLQSLWTLVFAPLIYTPIAYLRFECKESYKNVSEGWLKYFYPATITLAQNVNPELQSKTASTSSNDDPPRDERAKVEAPESALAAQAVENIMRNMIQQSVLLSPFLRALENLVKTAKNLPEMQPYIEVARSLPEMQPDIEVARSLPEMGRI